LKVLYLLRANQLNVVYLAENSKSHIYSLFCNHTGDQSHDLSQWIGLVCLFMVFDATFKNILVISWRSVLLVEETGENHPPVSSHWQTLSHNVASSTPRLNGVRTHNFSCDRYGLHIGSCNPTIMRSRPRHVVPLESIISTPSHPT
jgi:hypothetical protein